VRPTPCALMPAAHTPYDEPLTYGLIGGSGAYPTGTHPAL